MRFLETFSALALLIGLSQAAGAQSCTPKVPASSLIEAPKWQMSINPTLPPQQFVDDKGELQGLNVELAREIAKRICVEAVFLRMDFPPMIPALRSGRFDAINTGLFWTEERSKMLYLVPYAQQAISIYTDPASSLKIEKFEDLAGRVVGVESATYTERKAREFNTEMVAKGLEADRAPHLHHRHRDFGGVARRPARSRPQHQRDRQLARAEGHRKDLGPRHRRHRHHVRLPRQAARASLRRRAHRRPRRRHL